MHRCVHTYTPLKTQIHAINKKMNKYHSLKRFYQRAEKHYLLKSASHSVVFSICELSVICIYLFGRKNVMVLNAVAYSQCMPHVFSFVLFFEISVPGTVVVKLVQGPVVLGPCTRKS